MTVPATRVTVPATRVRVQDLQHCSCPNSQPRPQSRPQPSRSARQAQAQSDADDVLPIPDCPSQSPVLSLSPSLPPSLSPSLPPSLPPSPVPYQDSSEMEDLPNRYVNRPGILPKFGSVDQTDRIPKSQRNPVKLPPKPRSGVLSVVTKSSPSTSISSICHRCQIKLHHR